MSHISRRYFFYGSLLAGAVPAAGFGSVKSLVRLGYKSPNEKLNLAAIGAGGQPYSDLTDAAADVENVVALADVDWARAKPGFTKWPKATRYKDYRQMLAKQGSEIDAVVIGTPDHMHATCAVACMQLGKHVYVEKPLTHRTAWEARLLAAAAEKYKVATQMGNQGYSHEATRVACEIFWSGEIGEVKEVHAWHGKPGWPQGMQKVPAPTAIPDTLDWDLWLGGAAKREFTAGDQEYADFVKKSSGQGGLFGADPKFGFYLPFNWRGFFDFGSGLFGDWGVHILGPANWALQLGPQHLISVESTKKEVTSSITYPVKNEVKFEFGPRGQHAPGHRLLERLGLRPGLHASRHDARRGTPHPPAPVRKSAPPAIAAAATHLIFAGSKGYMGTSGRGEGVGLLPGSRWADYKLPAPYLQRSPGANIDGNHAAHCRDWIRACKGGAPACSNFSIAAPYTEWLVLGAVASHYEGKLLWDNQKMEFRNNKEASKWIKPAFRKGWELKI